MQVSASDCYIKDIIRSKFWRLRPSNAFPADEQHAFVLLIGIEELLYSVLSSKKYVIEIKIMFLMLCGQTIMTCFNVSFYFDFRGRWI